MLGVTMIIQLVFAVQADIRESRANYSSYAQSSMGTILADNLADQLFHQTLKLQAIETGRNDAVHLTSSRAFLSRRPASSPHQAVARTLDTIVNRPSVTAGYQLQFRRGELRSRQMHTAALAAPDGDPKPSNTSAEVDLDAPLYDDGGLAAAFRKRLDQEGGAAGLNVKIAVSDAGDAAKASARTAQRAVSDNVLNPADRAMNPVRQWWRRLDEGQQNIVKFIGAAFALNTIISAFSYQAPQKRPPSFEEYAQQQTYVNRNDYAKQFPQMVPEKSQFPAQNENYFPSN